MFDYEAADRAGLAIDLKENKRGFVRDLGSAVSLSAEMSGIGTTSAYQFIS